ncbi:uncharacterized protein NMK_2393 [Novimethylophilus kurashikiensis]|uniref:KfrA N-terminal DNA-binding domain-containing protein n=1 Tax=Novimethylophilus kurashikiensis TaxID=1825523 RepID=A0A2R5F969_9PROT|nr:DNA-binding protein [Novimethylophilus kurashikiensis]GBG14792.1 uncharacterized protein NMK_2393 [Novimethylophilus kurashikiensis]
MSTPTVPESQIQSEIDQLKNQFPQTRDLYREVCVLLFFRYGITPTANKLYQYVRKGSMSAPAEALNRFWLELRDKSRVRIEHPDLPEEIRESTGNFVGALWVQAQAAAQMNYSIRMAEAEEQVRHVQDEAHAEREKREKIVDELKSTKAGLENALNRLVETEKNHAVDISTLATLEKTLRTLQNEREQLECGLEAARQAFSADLEKVNVALAKAEERYRALEARALLEVDRERQRVVKLEKEFARQGNSLREQQRQHIKELAAAQKMNSDLRERLGVTSGQLTQLKLQQKDTAKKLNATQRSLESCKQRLQHKKA